MNSLIVSYGFPDSTNQINGIFVKKQGKAISKKNNVIIMSPRHLGLRKVKPCAGETLKVSFPSYIPFLGNNILNSLNCFVCLFSPIKKAVEKNKIDVIHTHMASSLSLAVEWIGEILEIPVVLQCHGSDLLVFPDQGLWKKKIVQKALSNADSVIVVSKALKDKAVKLGCREKKISIIHNGVDADVFKPKSMKNARDKLGLGQDKKIVLYVGSLIRAKGVNDLSESANHFSNKVEFWFLGEGIERKNIEKKHVKLAGKKQQKEVADWLNACNVFVLPSYSEGMPCTLLEAMACETAVIASNIPGNREIVENEKNGLLFEQGNITELKEKIALLLEKPWLAKKLGKNASETIERRKLWWMENAEQTVQVYKLVQGEKLITRKEHSLRA